MNQLQLLGCCNTDFYFKLCCLKGAFRVKSPTASGTGCENNLSQVAWTQSRRFNELLQQTYQNWVLWFLSLCVTHCVLLSAELFCGFVTVQNSNMHCGLFSAGLVCFGHSTKRPSINITCGLAWPLDCWRYAVMTSSTEVEDGSEKNENIENGLQRRFLPFSECLACAFPFFLQLWYFVECLLCSSKAGMWGESTLSNTGTQISAQKQTGTEVKLNSYTFLITALLPKWISQNTG